MPNRNQGLSQWVQEGRRALTLLKAWRDALVRRDLATIDSMHIRLQSTLHRLERLRAELTEEFPRSTGRPPEEGSNLSDMLDTAIRQQALEVARAIDEIVQNAYDIILNELDYTHALMAMLTRAAEQGHYAPLNAPSTTSTLLLNTEV